MSDEELNVEELRELILLCELREVTFKEDFYILPKVFKLGVQHGVGAWCYYRIKKHLIRGVKERQMEIWKKVYLQNCILYQQKLSVFCAIKDILIKEGIPVIALKGMALASGVYEDEGLRPMGDLDILVSEGEGMRALRLLQSRGAKQAYVCRSPLHEAVHSHVRAIYFEGVMVEIHQRLFSLGNPYHVPEVDYFKSANVFRKHGKEILILNNIWFGYHLIAHVASNLRSGSLRLGWLIDIALMLHKQEDGAMFLEEVLSVNSKQTSKMLEVVQMALCLLSAEDAKKLCMPPYSRSKVEAALFSYLHFKDDKKIYRYINLKEILSVPGISNKLKLLSRELFPTKAYLLQWNEKEQEIWKIYLKRWVSGLNFFN